VAKLSVLEQETTALRASLQERNAQIETVNGEAQANAAQAADRLAEIERQRGQIAELVGEREAGATGLHTEIAALREALATAERRAQGAEAVPEIRAELTRLSDALARAEQEVWERAGLIETMRAELLSLSETLALTRRGRANGLPSWHRWKPNSLGCGRSCPW
jgi:chromosome segregation ATPase